MSMENIKSSPEFIEYQESLLALEHALNTHQKIICNLSLSHPGNPWAESVAGNFRLTKNAMWESIAAPTKETQSFDFAAGTEAVYDFDWSRNDE